MYSFFGWRILSYLITKEESGIIPVSSPIKEFAILKVENGESLLLHWTGL
jgi:hypothetical protein